MLQDKGVLNGAKLNATCHGKVTDNDLELTFHSISLADQDTCCVTSCTKDFSFCMQGWKNSGQHYCNR